MTRHGLAWLIVIIALLLFAPLLVRQATYERCYVEEMETALSWYSADDAQSIVDRANGLYDWSMVRSGLDPFVRDHFTRPVTEATDPMSEKVSKVAGTYAEHVTNYGSNFLQNVWLFCFRLAHSLSWLLYLAPFIVAIIFDGIMTRKAKLASFKYTSPTIYNLSWHTIIALASGALVTFAVVSPLPILLFPAVLTLMGLLLRLVIANIQHSA